MKEEDIVKIKEKYYIPNRSKGYLIYGIGKTPLKALENLQTKLATSKSK